ncbi:PKD domain-containing protein [Algoriphagus machipongonensis]|uniref:PKD domain-containing protein n=1 Tax=Algoriphagus machipongonensis TaxID=388413 RepID=UPI001ED972E8|nr:PKD domain-containing protein [Algoriphagus machipongonensis]
MRKILLRSIIILMSFYCSFQAQAQTSTIGKEFWVGFMDNNRILPDAPDQGVIVISANEDATGVIEYRGRTVNFSISQGEQFTHTILSSDIDMHHRFSGVIENKGIYISSSGKISVYAFNERFRSADGTVVLPIETLGKDYLVTSHYELMTVPVGFNPNNNDESQLLVVATEDDTEIEITSSVFAFGNNDPGIPFTITLDRGQSYQLKAKDDLTGSRIRVIGETANSCKKIAVFGGNKWTTVGNCGGAPDNLFQQTYPTSSWGSSFVHVALDGRTSGELVKVLASEDNTDVFVKGDNVGQINAGEFLTLDFKKNESAKIETSKPSSVTVFSKSQECNEENTFNYQDGDPFMITYSPSEQFLKEIRFNAMSLPSIVSHFLNIVVKTGTEDLTFLDGKAIGHNFSPVPGDASYSFARMKINQGIHRISNIEGFAGYVYGFGYLESYGYAVGAALDNLNFETEVEYDFDVEGEKVACLGQEGNWIINPENPSFTYFVWDFGDGSEMKEGREVSHVFEEPGTYEVNVIASLSPTSCDGQEEINFEVVVQPFPEELEIVGAEAVCPEVEEQVYKLSSLEGISSVDFEVLGGEILMDYGDSVLVSWGEENTNAEILAIPYTENGCPGEQLSLGITISKIIDIELAEGELQVCFDGNPHSYTAPSFAPGRIIEWTVTGGTILEGQGEKTVNVLWDQPGITGILTYSLQNSIDNTCGGVSSDLLVEVADVFEGNVVSNIPVSCFGGDNGEVEIEILGGIEPYVISWSHDPSLNSKTATSLPAGTYQVTVTDDKGCQITLDDIIITEPNLLELENINTVAASCFGKDDGELLLEISGGVAPYTYEREGSNTFSGNLALNDMSPGTYNWDIVDANGCILPVSFEITSPPALDVEIRLEKPACPGGSNGELLAFPQGGIAPYVYTWEDPSGLGNQLTGVGKGTYNLSVLDALGCVSIGVGVVKETAPDVRMPTGYNPEEGVFKGCQIVR